MEGVFFVLVGGALFSQSCFVLGLYAEGRTMGIFVGGLGLLSLVALALDPLLLTGAPAGSDMLAETTVMKTLIIAWALYAVGVGAQGLWDFDERAVGFYSGFLAIATLVPLIFFAVELEGVYSNEAWLGLSAATLLLTVLSSITFFHQALQFSVLRLVSGWFLLLGGSVVGIIGLAIVSTAIS